MKHPITLQLELDDVDYILSMLDEDPQDGREYHIREVILSQTYD
tara:strand:+ start:237 stop:368 length:132 start_codon:yes stop_codon:yes gene_type:complete